MATSSQALMMVALCQARTATSSPLPSSLLGTSQIPWKRYHRQVFMNSRAGSSSRVSAWFKFGNRGLDSQGAGIYGSQKRDDFNRDDVEQYFNYMGMLATEGTYDKMDALLNEGLHPVDILLLMASSEGDKPKIEELLRAGARYDVKDSEGRTALDRAKDQEIKDLIENFKAVPSS